MKNKGAAERLNDLKGTLQPEGATPGGGDELPPGPGAPRAEPGPGEPQDVNFTPEQVADMVIRGVQTIRAKHGLPPAGEIETTLLRVGIIGTAAKYNISSFGLANYPELIALGAGGYIVYDTVGEIKAKVKREEAETKPEAGQGGPGDANSH